jgi:hypothetical protein
MGTSVGKNSPVDRVDLDLPFCFPTRLFEPKIKTSNPGKQAAEC